MEEKIKYDRITVSLPVDLIEKMEDKIKDELMGRSEYIKGLVREDLKKDGRYTT